MISDIDTSSILAMLFRFSDSVPSSSLLIYTFTLPFPDRMQTRSHCTHYKAIYTKSCTADFFFFFGFSYVNVDLSRGVVKMSNDA